MFKNIVLSTWFWSFVLTVMKVNGCATGDGPALLIVDQDYNDIVYFNLLTNESHRCNFSGLNRPIEIDVDIEEGLLFISNYLEDDGYAGYIVRSNLDGSDMVVIADATEASYCQGLAVDTINRHVYYLESQFDKIIRMGYDGEDKTDIITTGLNGPFDIVVDPTNDRLYWSDINSPDNCIETSRLDGSSRSILVDTDIDNPTGIHLDSEGRLYWCDWGLDDQDVEVISTDGSGRQQLSVLTDSYFMDLVVYGDNVYLTDARSPYLHVMPRSGGPIEVVGGPVLSWAWGIAVLTGTSGTSSPEPSTTTTDSSTSTSPCACFDEQREAIACEDRGNVNLDCSVLTVIRINYANYGRTTEDDKVCWFGSAHNNETDCVSESSEELVRELCEGQQSCSVPASDDMFGDPCTGTYKYLQVRYQCV